MLYVEFSREKIFPVAVVISLIICALGAFILFDAASGFTGNANSLFQRVRADTYYWLFFKYPEGSASAYAEATSTASAQSIPALLYHGEDLTKGNTPVSLFVDQMRALKKDGWQTITMAQFEDFMKNGKKLPDKSFLLTFDDGRRDTFYPFDPVIKDMGFHAIMFVVTGFSMPDKGQPAHFYLNKSELQFMLDSGRWELQSHGDLDHFKYNVQSTTDLSKQAKTVQGEFLSNKMWNEAAGRFETDAEFQARINNDLTQAKQKLEATFDNPIYAFAFPFNDYGPGTVNFPGSTDIIAKVVPSIYTFAFYQHWPGNGDTFNYPDKNTFMIRRLEPAIGWNGQDLINALDAARAKPLPYTATNIGAEWVGTWGGFQKTDSSITLSAKKDTTGSTAFLDGSGLWRDYMFSADVNWITGQEVALIARNANDTDDVECSLTPSSVSIDVQHGDQQTDLAYAPLTTSRGAVTFGMRVQGQSVQCYINGNPVVSSSFSGLSSGGVGLKVWDKTPGVAQASFSNISARSI